MLKQDIRSGRAARKRRRFQKREANDPMFIGRRRSLRLWFKRLKTLGLVIVLFGAGIGIAQLFVWYIGFVIVILGGIAA